MKIVATVTDCGDAVNAGGGVERRSCLIDLPEPPPKIIRQYLESIEHTKSGLNIYSYKTLSFSILDED